MTRAQVTTVTPGVAAMVSAGVVAVHDGAAPATVTARGAWLEFGPTSGTWRIAPAAREFYVSITERHIRTDADREAGIQDQPLGQKIGPAEHIREYLAKALTRAEQFGDETYEVHFYGQNIAGYNTDEIVVGHFHGRDLREVFRRAEWDIEGGRDDRG